MVFAGTQASLAQRFVRSQYLLNFGQIIWIKILILYLINSPSVGFLSSFAYYISLSSTYSPAGDTISGSPEVPYA